MPIIYRDASVADALGVLNVYRDASMISLDEGITIDSQEERDFWQDWVHKWEWRIAQPSQHFVVAVDDALAPSDSIVGVGRGGVLFHQETNANQSLLDLRQKEIDCIAATVAEEVCQYGLEG